MDRLRSGHGLTGRAVRLLAALFGIPGRREALRQPRQPGLHAGGDAAVRRRRAHGRGAGLAVCDLPARHRAAVPPLRITPSREQLRRYANLRVEDDDQADKAHHWGRPARNDNLFHRLARQRVGHLLQGAQQSLTTGFHYTIRDFRLMLSVAVTGDADDLTRRDELLALRESMSSTLRSASLPNRVCDAADLINWCALFTNPDRISQTDAPNLHYDDGREIRDQIVDFDTIQDPHPAGLRLWKENGADVLEARFYSIKSFPERFALWQMGSLIGDLMQPALQYSAPFLLTMGVHVLDPNVMKSVVTRRQRRTAQRISTHWNTNHSPSTNDIAEMAMPTAAIATSE